MPEGPTIVLMKEDLRKYVGKTVVSAVGNAKIEKDKLVGKVLKEIRLYGKQTYLVFDEVYIEYRTTSFINL